MDPAASVCQGVRLLSAYAQSDRLGRMETMKEAEK